MFQLRTKFYAAVWLLAVALNAFVALTVSAAPPPPSNFVYCPLTHKLQPIKVEPPRAASSDEICAPVSQKLKFAELLIERGAAAANLDNDRLGNLFFDFSRAGRAALDAIPSSPGMPRKSFITSEKPLVTSTRGRADQSVVKFLTERFAVNRRSRAPSVTAGLPETEFVFPTTAILRRIAPRGPPALL